MAECPEIKFNHVFTWNIKQLSSCILQPGVGLNSPLFIADCIEETIWCLVLYPFGDSTSISDNVVCLLQLIGDNEKLRFVYCSFIIEIIGSNGKPVISKRSEGLFSKDNCSCRIDFPKKYVFEDSSTCSSNNTLTIRCSIRAKDLPAKATISKNVARTKFCVDRSNLKWTANMMSGIECKRFKCPGKSFYEISLQVLEGDLVIHISRLLVKIPQQMAVCTISLLDTNGLESISATARHLFQPNCEVWEFPCFSAEKLKFGSYYMNGIFSLKCDFSVSNGSIVQEIDNLYVSSINSLPVPNVDTLTDLKNDFLTLLESQKFADVRIKVQDETFLVHKNILCARSPVFSAMFENDMIETQTGVIDIQDVEKHILIIFLKFLYTGTVKNNEMNYYSAMKLLIVADKYQVISLTRNCCCFLMKSLTDENVCEVLDVADMIGHDLLKTYAVNYIKSHPGTILPSDEWKRLVEKNLKLSTEIVCQISSNLGSACQSIRA